MKKILAALLTLSLTLCPCASVAMAAVPEGKIQTTSANGREFIFQMKNLYVVPGYDVAYLDGYEFDLGTAATAAENGGDVYVALEDLAKIYGPDFHVAQTEGGYGISHAGLTAYAAEGSADVITATGTVTMANPVKTVNGKLCVPAAEFMKNAFGKFISKQDTKGWNTSASAEGKFEKVADAFSLL